MKSLFTTVACLLFLLAGCSEFRLGAKVPPQNSATESYCNTPAHYCNPPLPQVVSLNNMFR
ncbi:hypothetical protein PALA44_02386 [Pseudomonas aeruginosa]|nr:hypothetical protein PALA36_01386 [Pseudomonas aeruginosa]WBJ52277.1 hypothetical protein PALA44_02386 [Pseudomonas aeruginosa]